MKEQVKSDIQEEKEVLKHALMIERLTKEVLSETDTELAEKEVEEVEEEINPFHTSLGGDQVYDPRLAYIMTNLLRGVVQNGTGRRAAEISRFIGGKTGTTNNYVDAWFLGFSSNLVTGVWTGFDDNDTLGWGETGSKSALPIWKGFMEEGLKRYGERDFEFPNGIINVRVNKKTGRSDEGSLDFEEAFVEGTQPGARDDSKNEEAEQFSPFYGDDAYYEKQ
jgi:penicillin-binding protein 1A